MGERYIVEEQGNPKEVIIPVEDFRKIEELPGWDLDDEAVKRLREARRDRAKENKDAYVALDSI